MKKFEEEINEFLDDRGLDRIKIVYGNTIYVKNNFSYSLKNIRGIKLRSVHVNNESKPFLQLWVM